MATVSRNLGSTDSTTAAWNKFFNEAERARMLQEDNQAYKAVAITLTSVVALGLVGIVFTLYCVLN